MGNISPCYIYMIAAEDAPINEGLSLFKVGISANPHVRMASFQTANPFKLRILQKWKMPTRASALKAEKKFHDNYSGSRLNGEWFCDKWSAIVALEEIIVRQLAEIDGMGTGRALIHALLFAGLSEIEATDLRLALYGDPE